MSLFRIEGESLVEMSPASLESAGLKERQDLQRMLGDRPDALGEPLLVVAEEFSPFTDSQRRIDLLALDSTGKLVVIELKRTDDAGFADLQALRYAAMIRTIKRDRLLEAFKTYLSRRGKLGDTPPEQLILNFLRQEELTQLSTDPRIILVASDFTRELKTTVLWLLEKGIDIRCVQVQTYRLGETLFLDIDVVLPLPDVSDIQIVIREKEQERERDQTEAKRRERTSETLFSHGLVKPGDRIVVWPGIIEDAAPDDPRFCAHFAEDIRSQRNVIWDFDDKAYSLSGLSVVMRDQYNVRFSQGGLNGYAWWCLEGHKETLSEMAERLSGKEG